MMVDLILAKKEEKERKERKERRGRRKDGVILLLE